MQAALGAGGEGRPLHADIGGSRFDGDGQGLSGLEQGSGRVGAHGLREAHVGHQPLAEEGILAVAGLVDELAHEAQLPGLVAGLEAAHGGHGDQPVDAQGLQRPEIGAVVHLAGREPVPLSVPGQKRHRGALQGAQVHRP